MRLRRAGAFVAIAAVVVCGCQWVLGIESREAAPRDASAKDGPSRDDVAEPSVDADAADAGDADAALVCPSPLEACNGECVRIDVPERCGACVHDCLDDAGCIDGTCRPTVALTLPDSPRGLFLANDSDFIVSSATSIDVVSRAGVLRFSVPRPADAAYDGFDTNGAKIFLAYGGRVESVAFATKVVTTYYDDPVAPLPRLMRTSTQYTWFFVGDDLYVADDSDGSSKALTTIAGATALFGSLTYAYVGVSSGDILRVDRATGAVTAYAKGPADPVVIALEFPALQVASRTSVWKVVSGVAPSLEWAGGAYITALAPRDGKIYVVDRGDEEGANGRLVRVDEQTGAVLDLLRGLSAPLYAYVDGPYAFTMDRGRTADPHVAKVLRVAR